ncbi:MAG: hypothetical protein KDD56_05405 [Bdellovibrionales bacterium]|nr:hypothetical protein [Bdellovibrionales bacterium]
MKNEDEIQFLDFSNYPIFSDSSALKISAKDQIVPNKLSLQFYGNDNPQLAEISVCLNQGKINTKCVRGLKSSSKSLMTFPWSAGVKALCLLILRTKRQSSDCNLFPSLEGLAGSPAASLDYAISKQPQWLLDMFGVNKFGKALIKQLIQRENPERKRPGPVRVYFKAAKLNADEIEVYLDGHKINSYDKLYAIEMQILKSCLKCKR